MFKRVVVVGAVVALVAVLGVGAVNWTIARQGNAAGHGQGRTSQVEENGRGGGWWKQTPTTPSSPDSGEGTARGGGRGNQTGTDPANLGTGQAPAADWETLNGIVESVDKNTLVVKLDSGAASELATRAWSYAQQAGFTAQPGDKVSLYGFYEDVTFETAVINNLTTGQNVVLRDDNGRPMWAGRGRTG